MTHDPKKYLVDMLDGCRFLLEVTAGKTLADYNGDRVFRSAVQRELQNIGEALWQMQAHNPESAGQITDHQRIIRVRHVLVHGYHDLKPQLVWDVIEHQLAPLRDELETLMGEP